MGESADLIENAVEAALGSDVRTGDIMADGFTQTGTDGMISKVINGLDAQARWGAGMYNIAAGATGAVGRNAANAC